MRETRRVTLAGEAVRSVRHASCDAGHRNGGADVVVPWCFQAIKRDIDAAAVQNEDCGSLRNSLSELLFLWTGQDQVACEDGDVLFLGMSSDGKEYVGQTMCFPELQKVAGPLEATLSSLSPSLQTGKARA